VIDGARIALLLPARNEEEALPSVLRRVPAWIDRVVVVDNGSTDATAAKAAGAGAEVVSEPRRGYGGACLAGLRHLASSPPDLVAFADADGSDELERLDDLVGPVVRGQAEMTLARRLPVERGALTPQQRFGNRVATLLIRLFWGHAYADLGPMRVIAWRSLTSLEMDDRGCGWTVQMQVRALKRGIAVREVGLPYRRRRAGRSKVSATVAGSVRAGSAILREILREATAARRPAG
jgi:glycosyltransferase involved in cell wall biosynthesis